MTSRNLTTCNINLGSRTLPALEAGDVVELFLLYMAFYENCEGYVQFFSASTTQTLNNTLIACTNIKRTDYTFNTSQMIRRGIQRYFH
jgi:hypothetical protein